MAKPVSTRTYVFTFVALLVLTAATTGFAYVDIPAPWREVVALTIAGTKMTLVLLFFMHLRTSELLMTVVAAAALTWLLILLGLTLADYLTRGGAAGSPLS